MIKYIENKITSTIRTTKIFKAGYSKLSIDIIFTSSSLQYCVKSDNIKHPGQVSAAQSDRIFKIRHQFRQHLKHKITPMSVDMKRNRKEH